MRNSRHITGLAGLVLLAAVSCSTTPSFDGARELNPAKSLNPPAGQGVAVGRVLLEVSQSKLIHAGDGVLFTSREGASYRVRADSDGWFCVWLPAGRYRCESLVAYLGHPDGPVVGMCPRNEFEVDDQQVDYLGTLKAATRVEEAPIGYDMWIEVQYIHVVDESADAAREMAKRYPSATPALRPALLKIEEP
jgi:hypothetical protein